MKIEVYSDGSATSDDKPGGYGWVLVADGVKVDEGKGYMPYASNNDAELEAAIQGLAAAFRYTHKPIDVFSLQVVEIAPPKVTLISDSQIILNWANGTWRFKQEAKIQKYNNLIKLMKLLNADTRWVRGHSGDEHNERCDLLANAARLQIEATDRKRTRISKIGKKTEGVVLFSYKGNMKIVDFVNNRCEDYSIDHALIESVTVIKASDE